MGTNFIGRTGKTTLAVASATCIGLLAAACSSASSSASAPAGTGQAGGAVLRTEHASMGTVLANGQGYTVYWFAADHGTTSNCTGPCAATWPPVTGMPTAASGVMLPGKLGAITRAGGQSQATYGGHPLYTFKGDSAPGQANGNGIVSFGAAWYAITVGAGTSSSPTATSGYGY